VLVAALLLYGLAGTAGYILDTLSSILLTRAVVGLAMGGLANGFVTLLADYFSGARLNQFMGYQGACVGFGGVVVQLLAGALADLGWRFPFLMHLLAFVILLGVLFTVDEPQPQAQAREQNLPDDTAAVPLQTMGLIYGIAVVGMASFFTVLVQLPFYLTTQAGPATPRSGWRWPSKPSQRASLHCNISD
jgi:MFS family permease